MVSLVLISDSCDPLVEQLAADAAAAGRVAERLSFAEAAGRFSVSRLDGRLCVVPRIPIFLRLPSSDSPWIDDEARFHRAEIFSLVWAAATLTDAPVINRPDAHGYSGRFALSTSVVRARAGIEESDSEIFASQAPEPCGPSEEWWLEQQADRLMLPWSSHEGSRGPYRAGRVRAGAELRVVTVVGAHAFSADPDVAVADLPRRSAATCAALGLAFATVTWRWYADDVRAEFGRVSPYPHLEEIGSAWNEVSTRLLALLTA